jgi:hypothetical protein
LKEQRASFEQIGEIAPEHLVLCFRHAKSNSAKVTIRASHAETANINVSAAMWISDDSHRCMAGNERRSSLRAHQACQGHARNLAASLQDFGLLNGHT